MDETGDLCGCIDVVRFQIKRNFGNIRMLQVVQTLLHFVGCIHQRPGCGFNILIIVVCQSFLMQLFVRDRIDRVTDAIPGLIQQCPDLISQLLRIDCLFHRQTGVNRVRTTSVCKTSNAAI